MTVKDLHRKAMEYNDQAIIAKSKGEDPKSFYLKAFEFEKQAYALFVSKSNAEPTRSVLLRSAASLAMMAGLNVEAEKLIGLAISGNPPEEILEELRDLNFENIKCLVKEKLSSKKISKITSPSTLKPDDTVTLTLSGEVIIQNIDKNAGVQSGKIISNSTKKDSNIEELSLLPALLNKIEKLDQKLNSIIINQKLNAQNRSGTVWSGNTLSGAGSVRNVSEGKPRNFGTPTAKSRLKRPPRK